MSRKGKGLFLALLISVAVVCALVSPANAAIGIYKWAATADASCNTATIQYYLNTDATSGTVDIKNSAGEIVQTIDLGAAGKLAKGTLHNVTWNGRDDRTGKTAVADIYSAVITVHAAPVVTSMAMMWNTPDQNSYGIAVDTNPANSTFGRVYISRISSKNLDVYEPDGTFVRSIATGFAGGSAPWGVAVGISGRVYSCDRSKSAVGNFDPIASPVVSKMGGAGTNVLSTTPTVALNDAGTADAAFYYCDSSPSSASTNHIRRSTVASDFTFGTSEKATGDGVFNGRPTGLTFGYHVGGQSTLYVANCSSGYGNLPQGVEKWVSTTGGTGWTKDASYSSATNGTTNLSVSISALPNGSQLVVSYPSGSNNIQIINKADGANVVKYSVPVAFAPGNVDHISCDAFGNVAACASNSNISGFQVKTGLLALPDADPVAGSADTRIAGTFQHIPQAAPPTLTAGTLTPNTLPGDNATTASFSGTVTDLDGADGTETVSGTIVVCGVNYTLTFSKINNTTWTASASGIKVPRAYKTGTSACAVKLKDSFGLTNTGILDPPQYVNLTVTGGTLAGNIKLWLDDSTPVSMARVAYLRVKDKNVTDGSKDYKFTVPAGTDGAFSVSVHAGTFTVSADADTGEVATTGYAAGSPIANVVVALNGTVSGLEPGVKPLTISQAKAVNDGVDLCVKGISVSDREDTVNFLPGFTNRWYLRDSFGPGGTYDGIRVDTVTSDPCYPFTGQTVAVEGRNTTYQGKIRFVSGPGATGNAPALLTSATILNGGASADIGQPDAIQMSDVSYNPGGAVDPKWGRFVKLGEAKVVAVDTTGNYLKISTDGGTTYGWVDCYPSTGIATGSALAAYQDQWISVTGVLDRYTPWFENAIQPRKADDIVILPSTKTYTAPETMVQGTAWNLIGVPAEPVNSDPLEVFKDVDIANASLQYWDNSEQEMGFIPYGMDWMGPIVAGTPYWFVDISFTGNRAISFEGNLPLGIANKDIKISAHAAAPYWVMISSPFDGTIPAADVKFAKGETPADADFKTWADAYADGDTTQWLIDAAAQGWSTADSSYFTVSALDGVMPDRMDIEPWYGYWMLMEDVGPITIRFPKPAVMNP